MVFLVDLRDADSEIDPQDGRLTDLLQTRMSDYLLSGKVLLLTRHRLLDPVDRIWRGWERKRGKIEEFCRLLLEDGTTSFQQPLPEDLRGLSSFVTLDIDTRLMPNTITLLMRAADREAAIVAPMLEDRCGADASWFERMVELASRRHTYDPNLNFNQSRLGYDLYYGKGLIIADRFLARTRGRISERSILSHDHLESMLVGAVASSTAQVREEIPRSRAQWVRRQYRWTRGDFQILPWILRDRLPIILRLHLLEVVLSHLVPPCGILLATIALLTNTWPKNIIFALFCLLAVRPTLLLLPVGLPLILFGTSHSLIDRWRRAASVFVTELVAWALSVVYAPGNMLIVVHSALITTWRLCWSGRNLLEWEDNSPSHPRTDRSALAIGQLLLGTIALGMALRTSQVPQVIAIMLSLWLLVPLALSTRLRLQQKSNGETESHARAVICGPPNAD